MVQVVKYCVFFSFLLPVPLLQQVYPVSALGGIQYIAALKKPFPHIPLIASQGITVDLVGEYIAHGATSVVLSDAIFSKKAMGERNFETIYQLSRSAASQAIEAVERLEFA
ncbi:unnamed protein product [Coffea canephora]|uniref:Uncharacterized protein n=1 Tax=Coffea canephora TaxID=49390 RepID=A0A068UCJ9_COFCA|nr:unnamed protein product [Coffea canephora]